MSYLNHDYSLSYSIQQPNDSTQSEAQFLKIKLIETHSKLIQELEYSKKLEQELATIRYKMDATARSNEQLNRKMQTFSSKQERSHHDRLKQIELNLVESEKKNDLLRGDLETMRNKTLQLVAANQKLQEQCAECERSNIKLNDKLNVMSKEVKLREISQQEFKQQAERYRIKYDKQVINNQQIQSELQDIKSERDEMAKRYQQLEQVLRQQRDKQSKQFNEILLLQKESKDWKIKAEQVYDEIAKIKDQAYQLKMRTKGEQKNLAIELEKLTQDYNNLQSILRQRQNELQSARLKTAESYSKKKHTFEHTKEMVGKMEREENKLINKRASPTRTDKSPYAGKGLKSYKQEKQDYLTMIESVGTMESQMLNCNMEKKKILAEIDKIDETRIKTKEMISKRRRLEVQLQNQERKLEHIRGQLKKMKVM